MLGSGRKGGGDAHLNGQVRHGASKSAPQKRPVAEGDTGGDTRGDTRGDTGGDTGGCHGRGGGHRPGLLLGLWENKGPS